MLAGCCTVRYHNPASSALDQSSDILGAEGDADMDSLCRPTNFNADKSTSPGSAFPRPYISTVFPHLIIAAGARMYGRGRVAPDCLKLGVLLTCKSAIYYGLAYQAALITLTINQTNPIVRPRLNSARINQIIANSHNFTIYSPS
jgi:hypothetical protein